MDRAPDYDDYDDDDFEEEDAWIDCGLGPDGQCSKAGSEECDWECPYSHGEHYAGSELWCKAHDAGLPVEGCECRECRAARFPTPRAAQGRRKEREMTKFKGTPGPWMEDGIAIVAGMEKVCFMGEPAQYAGDISRPCPNHKDNARAIAELPCLLEALEPLARLEVPKKPQGNAGAYSIRHEDILRARAALSRALGDAGEG